MYEVKYSQSKGRHIVATKDIPKNTIIIKELPFLTAEDAYDALYQLYRDADDTPDTYFTELFETLTPSCIDRCMISYADISEDLKTLPSYISEYFMQWKPEKLILYVAKFYRNAFRYKHANAAPCALLRTGTLLNHSCDNNVDFHTDKNGYFIFKANRDIYKGEELCDTYIETNMSTKKRKQILFERYNFACNCTKCVA